MPFKAHLWPCLPLTNYSGDGSPLEINEREALNSGEFLLHREETSKA